MNTYFKISLQMHRHSLNSNILLEVVYWIDLNKEYYGNETFVICYAWVKRITS